MKITDKEFAGIFNKCLRNGVRIYPKPTSEGGGRSMTKGAKKRKASVKIIVDYGNKIVESSETYTQEEDLTDKVVELYCHIAERL